MWKGIVVTLACLVAPAAADDNWSDPYPGVRRLHRVTGNQNINAVVVDLCAPGIGIRATANGERGRTVPSFGSSVGAAVAVNGDFFGSGYGTDGPSRSGGAAWGGGDHGYVAPLAFGEHRVSLAPHEDTGGVPGWGREVVSGHPSIVIGGAYRDNNGDPLCSNRHPRTAAGISADRRKLVLAVVDGRASTRIGMNCGELASLMQELGAHDVVNLDGGGSSTMWLGNAGVVNNPSDGSPRVVGNHLAVHATGSGEAPFCPSTPPRGHLDSASCEAITGWAQDPDVPDTASQVEVWVGGPPGSDAPHFTATADVHRDDLCSAIGSCAHGFAIPVPPFLRDDAAHEIWIEGRDTWGVTNATLADAPRTLSCAPAAVPYTPATAKRRWVPNLETLAGWKWGLWDLAKPAQATIDSYTDGPEVPLRPDLVRVTARPEVYVLDGDLLRHVRNPDVMKAWRFEFGAVREISEADAAAFVVGAKWPDVPYLMLDQTPGNGKVYLVDSATPEDPAWNSNPLPEDQGGGCAVGGDAGLLGFAVLGLAIWVRRRDRRAKA
jgi:hypothetical protein